MARIEKTDRLREYKEERDTASGAGGNLQIIARGNVNR